jgi:hypothetical protein
MQQAACRRHCTTFPKAVSQLAGAIPFQSVELSLTQGRWVRMLLAVVCPVIALQSLSADQRDHYLDLSSSCDVLVNGF